MINLVYQFATRPSTVQIFEYNAATKIKKFGTDFSCSKQNLVR